MNCPSTVTLMTLPRVSLHGSGSHVTDTSDGVTVSKELSDSARIAQRTRFVFA